ncbi:hypothetical protein BaRGS_00011308, partial [Batillaria attramentaria]
EAEVRNFTINQHPYFDTVTEGDRSVTFICEASGHPTPTLHISFRSEQVALSQHTSDISITSQTVLTYTILHVICANKGNYTCTADNGFTGVASASVQLHVKNCDATEDTPLAAIVGGVVGGILVLTTAAVVGVLIWMKRNPRYEKPLPRRERESDAYTGIQPSNNDTDRQTSAGIANHQLTTDLDEENCLHNYQNVSRPDNTYDPLQMTGRQDTAVYTDLHPTGSGGRGTDKAEVHNFTINQHPHTDTVTEGDRSVTFICEASGHPTPTLHISLGSEQVALSEHTSGNSITSQTLLTYTILHVICEDKGNYTCTADNGFTGVVSASVQLHVKNCDPRYEKPLPRRERESDAYTGLQPSNNDTDRQTAAGIANHQLTTDLDEENCLHNYQNLSRPDNTYDPLQMTGRQDTAVYTDLHPTGSGGRGTDKAEVRNFTINQHQHSDTVTQGDRSVTFICEGSGHPTPTLHISFESEQVAVSEHTSDISITSQTVLTYTIPRVNCDDK